ncbi:hypothetical protein NDU88_002964 [Pleurodeles waltl]|uniref:Uncharacterized protein n=1 Tax=Pleurodeles waltl TaxID=8319 RepID=A0AAV7W0T3_PLEWA|nr:hypothetical protein NDU88_002964 [Pleurodeles waltl]
MAAQPAVESRLGARFVYAICRGCIFHRLSLKEEKQHHVTGTFSIGRTCTVCMRLRCVYHGSPLLVLKYDRRVTADVSDRSSPHTGCAALIKPGPQLRKIRVSWL